MPVLVLLANTGIVMLHGDSITRWLDPDVRSVEVGSTETSLDAQLAAVQARFPTGAVREIKTATTPTSPTVFLISGTEQDELVFVDVVASDGNEAQTELHVGVVGRSDLTFSQQTLFGRVPELQIGRA